MKSADEGEERERFTEKQGLKEACKRWAFANSDAERRYLRASRDHWKFANGLVAVLMV